MPGWALPGDENLFSREEADLWIIPLLPARG